MDPNTNFAVLLAKAQIYIEHYFQVNSLLTSIIDKNVIQPKTSDYEDDHAIYNKYSQIFTDRSLIQRGYCRRAKFEVQNFEKTGNKLSRLYNVLIVLGTKERSGYLFKKLSESSFIIIVENGTCLISCDNEIDWVWIFTYFRAILTSINQE